MKRSVVHLAAIVLFACLLAPAADASLLDPSSIVFDNGAPNSLSGDEMGHWIIADDFQLLSVTPVGTVAFWAYQLSPTSYQGSIQWFLYADNAGIPGSIITSGNAIPLVTFSHQALNGPSYEYDFSIPNTVLQPGTYWLGLHNGPLTDNLRTGLYWETANANNTVPGGYADASPFDPPLWQRVSREHAFQIAESPEPGTLAMISIGIVILGIGRLKWL